MDAVFGFDSQTLVMLIGAFIGLVIIASTLISHRDAWLGALRGRQQLVRWAISAAVIALLIAFASTHLDELHSLLDRMRSGDAAWLAAAVGLEAVSFAAYVVLTHQLYSPRLPRLDWPTSTSLTLAGVVATRLLAAGGAGGIAFTAWVLHKAGMETREAARRLTAFLVLLYAVYIALLVLAGVLALVGVTGQLPTSLAVTAVIVGTAAISLAIAATYVPATLQQRILTAATAPGGKGRARWLAAKLATVPETIGGGVRSALHAAKRSPSLLWWAAVWWIFDVAVLWACFHAFGAPPDALVLAAAYFLGMLGNLLPIPGGVGGTEGGMTAVLAASGVPLELALASVVAYQVISSYLPALPGLAAYAHLRRRMTSWELSAAGSAPPGGDPADPAPRALPLA